MSTLKITVPELGRIREKYRRYPERINRAIAKSIEETGFRVERHAKKALTVGPTRALLTGFLRDTTKFYEFYPFKFEAHVYSIAEYAINVHEGTGSHRRIGPRPYMDVAAKRTQDESKAIFAHNIGKALA